MSEAQKTLPILYEDSDVLVIDKPAGVTVNNAETNTGEFTVQDFLTSYLKNELAEGDPESDFVMRSGFVHRIDKETSGVLLVAKNTVAFVELQRQFKERIIKKEYLALVHGKMAPGTGEIRVPVGRLPWDRKRFGIVPGGKESLTQYSVELYVEDKKGREILSFVRLNPQTGRTHQIRVHLKYQGYPIFADFLYAGRKTSARDRKVLGRVFLHAARLSFIHPVTGMQTEVVSPLPPELGGVLQAFSPVELADRT